MADVTFQVQQIEKFSDKIENCLLDGACQSVFEYYLAHVIRKDNLLYTLRLWIKANQRLIFDDDMFDLIDEVDGFNDDPLLTLAESHQKIAYVKTECCRLFNTSGIHQRFIDYLRANHQQ
ncbi:unnamed protein product [Tenebrio molitor]|jgi:hypothetical protein|nr:unnamed protein product [Tenebrio molitor]